ncbi:MAG: sigma-70 family RNA polymerase sigma factor [Ignavibacteria bacterium]|nr:sigma-70 family RNA polymerase sigma factor [Ignavibacteria bacterium]
MANISGINVSPASIARMDTGKNLQLLKRISEKDTSALSEFYDLHSKYLYTIIYFILRDESEAEDLLQEVFLQIWEKIDSYDESLGNPLAWISRITRNKSIDRLRSKSFKNRSGETDIDRFYDISSDSPSSNPEMNISMDQEQQEVAVALRSLNQNQRDLIEFAYFRGYSQSELAEHFQIPLGTVKTRMRAAMMLLRDKLKNLAL